MCTALLYFATYVYYSPNVFPLSLLTSTRLRKHSGFVCLRSGAEDELSKLPFLSDITSRCCGSTLKRPQSLPLCPLLIATHKQPTIQCPILQAASTGKTTDAQQAIESPSVMNPGRWSPYLPVDPYRVTWSLVHILTLFRQAKPISSHYTLIYNTAFQLLPSLQP